jgi:Zn-dependent protease
MPEFLAFSIIILLFSVIVHEVMHGLVALKFGDTTAQRAGRLTLNPIPHIDPVGTVLLPAIFFISGALTGTGVGPFIAWAKPVPVNPLNFTNLRKGELLVSAAGVLSNFALAIIAALLYHLLPHTQNTVLFLGLLRYAVLINLMLGFFNLLPIPPLDGSKVLLSQLPYHLARQYQRLEPYGFIILILLVFMPSSPLFFLLSFLVQLFTSILL